MWIIFFCSAITSVKVLFNIKNRTYCMVESALLGFFSHGSPCTIPCFFSVVLCRKFGLETAQPPPATRFAPKISIHTTPKEFKNAAVLRLGWSVTKRELFENDEVAKIVIWLPESSPNACIQHDKYSCCASKFLRHSWRHKTFDEFLEWKRHFPCLGFVRFGFGVWGCFKQFIRPPLHLFLNFTPLPSL